jgi:hypothetical protein
MNQAAIGLFHPLEEYIGPSVLTVGAKCFIDFLGCLLKFSFRFRISDKRPDLQQIILQARTRIRRDG